MRSYSKQLTQKINALQTLLKNCPEGNLICAKNGAHHKWYLTNDTSHHIYIPKNQRRLAEQLATKKYYTMMLHDLETEYAAVQSYLKRHQDPVSHTLLQKPGYDQLLQPHVQPLSQELLDWMNAPYEKNPTYQEQLIHKCASGIWVRSKSESMIVTSLQMKKIPFRYENALRLNELTIYPDFTIRHPQTGTIYYWEHFGMMDQPSYAKNAALKLQHYISCGIIPELQLITTYETKDHPLTIEKIERVIEEYFL